MYTVRFDMIATPLSRSSHLQWDNGTVADMEEVQCDGECREEKRAQFVMLMQHEAVPYYVESEPNPCH